MYWRPFMPSWDLSKSADCHLVRSALPDVDTTIATYLTMYRSLISATDINSMKYTRSIRMNLFAGVTMKIIILVENNRFQIDKIQNESNENNKKIILSIIISIVIILSIII